MSQRARKRATLRRAQRGLCASHAPAVTADVVLECLRGLSYQIDSAGSRGTAGQFVPAARVNFRGRLCFFGERVNDTGPLYAESAPQGEMDGSRGGNVGIRGKRVERAEGWMEE